MKTSRFLSNLKIITLLALPVLGACAAGTTPKPIGPGDYGPRFTRTVFAASSHQYDLALSAPN